MIPGDQADPQAFPAMVAEFCDHMGARGLSVATIEGRRAMVGSLSEWLNDRGVTRPAEVTKPMLDRYQRWLYHYRKADGQPLTFRSQHARLVAVRAFFRWATKANRILYNPASELEPRAACCSGPRDRRREPPAHRIGRRHPRAAFEVRRHDLPRRQRLLRGRGPSMTTPTTPASVRPSRVEVHDPVDATEAP
ncbi:MAG: site-specific integrase [Microthrixaceae bacterium]